MLNKLFFQKILPFMK